jgi:hypothetical protein
MNSSYNLLRIVMNYHGNNETASETSVLLYLGNGYENQSGLFGLSQYGFEPDYSRIIRES